MNIKNVFEYIIPLVVFFLFSLGFFFLTLTVPTSIIHNIQIYLLWGLHEVKCFQKQGPRVLSFLLECGHQTSVWGCVRNVPKLSLTLLLPDFSSPGSCHQSEDHRELHPTPVL